MSRHQVQAAPSETVVQRVPTQSNASYQNESPLRPCTAR
jgi:hypothetical protein